MRSCPQALQQHSHQGGIGVTFDPHLGLPQFNVNPREWWLRTLPAVGLDYHRSRLALAYPHWQQLDACLLLSQSSCQILPSPAKHLVGVHTVRPRYSRHRRARRQRLFHNPPLLGNAPLLSPPYDRALFVPGSDCSLLGGVHLCSKWTLIPMSTWREWLSFTIMSRRFQPDAYAKPNQLVTFRSAE